MEFRGTVSNPNPLGMVGPGGQFVNPAAFSVMTHNVLPVLPRQTIETAPITTSLKAMTFNQNAGAAALTANAVDNASQPSAPVVNSAPGAGSEGSSGNQGAPIALNPNGPQVNPVGYVAAFGGAAVKSWQQQHPTLSMLGRFGLPIGAVMLWRHGHDFAAIAAGGIAAILWVNR